MREEGLRGGAKQRTANKVLGDISREPKGARTGDISDMQEERDMDNELAEMTRSDLMDVVMERIAQMSKEDLINMLVRTRGTLEEKI